MGEEKFIFGKRDSSAHAGRRSNRQRLEAAMQQLNDWRLNPALPAQVEEGGLVEPFSLDDYYRSEQDPPRLVEGQLDTENPRNEYYVGVGNGLKKVDKTIYDAKVEIEKGKLARIRAELARFIKVRT